ncbi:UNVERIFIED_CONTAM: serine--tRNA ligase [Hammondia hammondi]|eukprot:XP_008882519.1 serine--tRNA ligase [Hammondia hammondi]
MVRLRVCFALLSFPCCLLFPRQILCSDARSLVRHRAPFCSETSVHTNDGTDFFAQPSLSLHRASSALLSHGFPPSPFTAPPDPRGGKWSRRSESRRGGTRQARAQARAASLPLSLRQRKTTFQFDLQNLQFPFVSPTRSSSPSTHSSKEIGTELSFLSGRASSLVEALRAPHAKAVWRLHLGGATHGSTWWFSRSGVFSCHSSSRFSVSPQHLRSRFGFPFSLPGRLRGPLAGRGRELSLSLNRDSRKRFLTALSQEAHISHIFQKHGGSARNPAQRAHSLQRATEKQEVRCATGSGHSAGCSTHANSAEGRCRRMGVAEDEQARNTGEPLQMMSLRHVAERGKEVLDALEKRHESTEVVDAARDLIENLLPTHRRLQVETWRRATERRHRAAAAFAASQEFARTNKDDVGPEGRESSGDPETDIGRKVKKEQQPALAPLHEQAAQARAAVARRVQELRESRERISDIMKRLPNALDSRVPLGIDSRDNQEVDRWWPPSLSAPSSFLHPEMSPPSPSSGCVWQRGAKAALGERDTKIDEYGGSSEPSQKAAGVPGTAAASSFERQVSPEASSSPSSHALLDHSTLLAVLNASTDGEATTRMAGRRHSALRGVVARLHRALKNYFLDFLLALDTEDGKEFNEVGVPPLIVSRSTLEGTGQLPRLENGLFALPATSNNQIAGENAFLIPTAEVPLVGFYRQKRIPEGDLPIRLTAATPCFRLEDGAYGRWNRGLLRQQVFEKVESVVICTPEQAEQEHARLRKIGKTLLKQLQIPFREVLLCSGDMSATAAICYDLEAWIPSLQGFLEVSSISNCWDYQARRLSVKFQPSRGALRQPTVSSKSKEAGDAGQTSAKRSSRFCFTLNGSTLAVGRTLVALLENHQFIKEDHSGKKRGVRIPKPLQPYLGGVEEILEDSPSLSS